MKKLHTILLGVLFAGALSLTNVNYSQAQESFFGVGIGWRQDISDPGINLRAAFPVSHNLLFQPDGTFFFTPRRTTVFEINGNLIFIFGNSNIQPYLFGGLNYTNASVDVAGYGISSSDWDLNLGGGLALDMGTWAPFIDFKYMPVNFRNWMTTVGARIYM